MILFKNDGKTMHGVLENQKHATDRNLLFEPGEIILIQQTKTSLTSPNQKSIRWVMNYVETYLDTNNESEQIWGRHWNYIIQGTNLRPIDPFNISDFQISDKDYRSAQIFAYVDQLDEQLIYNWIENAEMSYEDINELPLEFEKENQEDINKLISRLNEKYISQPNYKKTIVNRISRPTVLKNAIVKRDGTKCKICGTDGFIKKNGERYCELHHMIELNTLAPNTLQSWNVLIVCPTCHRQLHHGNTIAEYIDTGWRIRIDGIEHVIT